MDENTRQQIRQLIPALQSLEKSVRQALLERTFMGIGEMAVKSYDNLHNRIAQLMPDDFYVTDALGLNIPPEADEQQKVAQVQLAVSQLVSYLENQVRGSGDLGADIDDLKEISRSLRDRILAQTKDTIRRAMTDVEINIDTDWAAHPKRKRKVTITSDYDDEDYIGADLSGQNLQGRDFSDQDMTDANLSGSNLEGANFEDASLVHANFSGAILRGAMLNDADLTGANLSGANLEACSLEDAVLVQVNLSGAVLHDAQLEDANLTGANLSGAMLANANLNDATLVNVNFTGANLSSTNMRDADLSDADLRAANLRDASLRDASLTGANLRDANLHDADLRDANMRDAILPDGARYHDGDDLSRFHVRRGPSRRRDRGERFVPPTPPTPPVPPTPPTPPTPQVPPRPHWGGEDEEG